MATHHARAPRPLTEPQLSPRERQIVLQTCRAATDEQVATSLGISKHTVHAYVQRIYRRFGLHTRVELALRSRQEII